MKQADVSVGDRLWARVSGALVPVLVLRAGTHGQPWLRSGPARRLRFVCRNLKTGREVSRTAAALRPTPGWHATGDGGGHWEA